MRLFLGILIGFILLLIIVQCDNNKEEVYFEPNKYGVKNNIDTIQEINNNEQALELPLLSQDSNEIIQYFHQENIGQLHLKGVIPLPKNLSNKYLQNERIIELKDEIDQAVTSLNTYASLNFENDIFTNTDYYFTNGAQIAVISPALQHFVIFKFFPNAGKQAINHFGVGLRQNMYTPIDPEASSINYNDRPFSGILLVDLFKISTLHKTSLRLTTTFQIGVIGSLSLAGSLQNSLHKLEPSGWTYQIQNDLLINLNLAIEKSIFKSNYMDINGLAIGKLGTYQTQLAVGMQFRAGLIPRSFNPFVAAKPNSIEYFANERKLPVWIFFDIFSHRIFHDATLNGGSFSDKNSYTIQASNTEKYTLEMASGISARVKNSSISIKLVYLSTEFKHGKAHKWGAISLMHNL